MIPSPGDVWCDKADPKLRRLYQIVGVFHESGRDEELVGMRSLYWTVPSMVIVPMGRFLQEYLYVESKVVTEGS